MEILILFIPGSMSIRLNFLVANHVVKLRTVPTIVIAHTFCASPDTRISYRR